VDFPSGPVISNGGHGESVSLVLMYYVYLVSTYNCSRGSSDQTSRTDRSTASSQIILIDEYGRQIPMSAAPSSMPQTVSDLICCEYAVARLTEAYDRTTHRVNPEFEHFICYLRVIM
jgi:hypothetical protein